MPRESAWLLTFDFSSRHSREVLYRKGSPSLRCSGRKFEIDGQFVDALSLYSFCDVLFRLFRSLVSLILDTGCFSFSLLKNSGRSHREERHGYRHMRLQAPPPSLERRRSFAPSPVCTTPTNSSAVARAPTELRTIAGVHHADKLLRRR
jgi:hypothetical protein